MTLIAEDLQITGPLVDPYAPDVPLGMRISTDCPSRRFIEQYQPERYFTFDRGVGQAGHDIANAFIERRLLATRFEHDETGESVLPMVRAELPLPWAHGVSHVDAAVYDGPMRGSWEIKSTSKDWRVETVTPSAENVRQVKRMLYVAEQTGAMLPDPFRIVLVCKKDLEVCGPWIVELDDEDRDELACEFALLDQWMTVADIIDLDTDESLADACRCGQCFKPERVYLDDLADLVDYRYHNIAADPVAKWDRAKQDAQLKKLNAEAKALMVAAGETHAETGFYTATLDKRGSLTLRFKGEIGAVA